jgi:uncharacterized protein
VSPDDKSAVPPEARGSVPDPTVPPPPPGIVRAGPTPPPPAELRALLAEPAGRPDGAPAVGAPGVALPPPRPDRATTGPWPAAAWPAVRLRDAIWSIVLIVVVQVVVVGVGGSLLPGVLTDVPGASTLAVLLVAQVTGLVGVLVLVWRRGLAPQRLLGPAGAGMRQVRQGVLVGLLGTGIAYGLNAVLLLGTGADEPVEQVVVQELLGGGVIALVLAVVVAVVAAPVVEELLFRGLLQVSLRRRLGSWPAAIVSSVVFTLFHPEVLLSQPLALVGLLALSLVLARSMERTGSLVVPVVAHAVFNGSSIALALVADRFGLL